MSVIEDIQHRSAHIHWPEGIVPEQADLFAHNDIVIAAFGLRENRRREPGAAAAKPAPPGNPAIVAQPHHTFVTRPSGRHDHVNH